MGDLDFDVRITTNHLDAAALMSDIGAALAHGTFRVPARVSSERALELVVVARSGAVAMKGKVEVLGYEGEHTWLRFLSASDRAEAEAHLILTEVTLELAPRQGRGTAERASASTRPAPPARGTRPAPPRVVAVPPRTRPTASHPAVAEPPELPGQRHDAATPERTATVTARPPPEPTTTPTLGPAPGPAPRADARATARTTGVANAVRVPPRPPPSGIDLEARSAVARPANVARPAAPQAAPADTAPGAVVPPTAPQVQMPSAPAAQEAQAVQAVQTVQAVLDEAPPLPPPPSAEPVAQLPLESVVPWWTAPAPIPAPPAAIPAPPAPIPAPPAAIPAPPAAMPAPLARAGLASDAAAPPPRIEPLRHTDSVARFGTAPIETSQDAARAYSPDATPLSPVATHAAARTPLTRREKRVLGAAGAIAALGLAVAGAALWSTRPAPTSAGLATARCEPNATTTPAAEAEAPRTGAAAALAATRAEVAEASCQLQITSNASLAEVWIDGERRGKVPAQLVVPCRPTTIALRHPRYLAAQREVMPTPGTTEVALRLTRPLVSVKIESKPPGATVRVNGRAVGKTPLTTKVLAFERGTVVLSHDGGAIKTMQIYPQTDNTLVSATLPKPRARPRK